MAKRVIHLTCLLLAALMPTAAFADIDCVILLHGLGRTSASMMRLESRLENAGFSVVNLNYPSRDHSVEQLAGNTVSEGLQACEKFSPGKIHFVTHSMGGILVRFYFLHQRHHLLGRVVMLGPPNHGSEVVDRLQRLPGFDLLNGPSGGQLGTESGSVPRFLGPVNFELGVIAGNQNLNPLYGILIPGPDDGKVSVDSTRVEGMSEHLVMPVTHTWMMFNPEVIDQVVHFLSTGSFMLDDD